jgi:GAF domain-containing protein
VSSSDSAALDTWVWLCIQAELRAERAAEAAAEVAARHERLVAEGGESVNQLASKMAATHRRIESCQRAAARSHRAQADRLAKAHFCGGVVPELLITAASALGARSVALTLLGSSRYEESAIASNSTAAVAQELEFMLGEGPVHDAAASGRLVVVDETTMPARWAQYSPAVTELGVRSIAAAPLRLQRKCLGVLTVFDPRGDAGVVTVDGVARALVSTVLLAGTGATELLLEADERMVVHQATGMIAARLRCPVGDALATLRARAFAENERIGVLARRVVNREVLFE